jgi:Pectinacetylesterase
VSTITLLVPAAVNAVFVTSATGPTQDTPRGGRALTARIGAHRPRGRSFNQTGLTLGGFSMGQLATKTGTLVALLVVFAALAATVAGCGSSGPGEGATTGTKSAAQTPSSTAAPRDQAWNRVAPGGDCQCADGSDFSFWMRKANPKKVLLYLQDGGACYSAKTCAPERDLYNTSVKEGPIGKGGIFDFVDDRNPFADYSVVYVPYCTGDVHIGDTTAKYAPGLTVRHKGYVNGSAALDHLAGTFPDAAEVVVIGESAGSIAAPLYAGLVSDRLPDARITVLADGSGAYPDTPVINRVISRWGGDTAIPRWPENPRLGPGRWSFPGLFVQSGRHDPHIVFARHDYAYDAEQNSRLSRVGIAAEDLLARIDANETEIEDAGVDLLSYIAPGDEHTALSDGPFYTETVNGESLVDWVTSIIEGKPVNDVHCRECRAG